MHRQEKAQSVAEQREEKKSPAAVERTPPRQLIEPREMRIKAIIDSAARGLSARRSKERKRRKSKESDGILIKLQFCDGKDREAQILYHAPFCRPISFFIYCSP